MPSRSEVSYFGAGPAPLPTPALEESAKALLNFNDTGLSLAEISHRSPTANTIIADAKSALVKLLDIPENYEIIFLQGGGSGEFSATVQNLVSAWVERRRRRAVAELGEGKDDEVLERVRKEVKEELKADYLVTGSWSLKASQEAARLIGPKYVNIALDAREHSAKGKFTTIPEEKEWAAKLSPGGEGALVYYCDNETVDGVEFPAFPRCLDGNEGKGEENERIVVADMSSNFLSRKIDVKKYGVIFGGAQKNLGITGITLVITRKSLLALTPPPTFMHRLADLLPNAIPPIVFDFATIAKNNSLYNTLPIFNLYIATLVLQNLVARFGTVAGQEEEADAKAARLYGTLDKLASTYHVVPNRSVRSRMNICFRIFGKEGGGAPDEAREKAFVSEGEKKGLLGLKGHRSVGGIRVSNYNAVPVEAVEKLVKWIEEFAGQ